MLVYMQMYTYIDIVTDPIRILLKVIKYSLILLSFYYMLRIINQR